MELLPSIQESAEEVAERDMMPDGSADGESPDELDIYMGEPVPPPIKQETQTFYVGEHLVYAKAENKDDEAIAAEPVAPGVSAGATAVTPVLPLSSKAPPRKSPRWGGQCRGNRSCGAPRPSRGRDQQARVGAELRR